jgi:hypothetical protein
VRGVGSILPAFVGETAQCFYINAAEGNGFLLESVAPQGVSMLRPHMVMWSVACQDRRAWKGVSSLTRLDGSLRGAFVQIGPNVQCIIFLVLYAD